MQVITTTDARKRLAQLINTVRYSNRIVAIGRHNKAEVLLIKFPEHANPEVSNMTNMNQYGGGFEWLADEPDIYTRDDLKKNYV